MNLDINKPYILYPCQWEYRIIGTSKEGIEALIADTMPRAYVLESGKVSKNKHFVSVYVRIEVQSEIERNDIFNALKQSKLVKMVL